MRNQQPAILIISVLALVGGVFLFRKIQSARSAGNDDEAMLDEMVEQSFPASDPPGY